MRDNARVQRWRRIHDRPAGAYAMVMAAVLAGSCAIVLWVATALSRTPATPAFIASAVTVVLSGWMLRKWGTGLYVGPAGVKIRTATTTDIFRWSDIAGFDVQPSPDPERSGPHWEVLRIITTSGLVMATPVIGGNYWDSPIATKPMSTNWSWANPSSYPPGGIYLTDRELGAVITRLRAELSTTGSAAMSQRTRSTEHRRLPHE